MTWEWISTVLIGNKERREGVITAEELLAMASENQAVQKPKPSAPVVVENGYNDDVLKVFGHTSDARVWIDREIHTFGSVSRVDQSYWHLNLYAGFNRNEVANYLRSFNDAQSE